MSQNMNPPLFTVVIPLYNKVAQIENTLKSVFDQTFTDYEIVIVDDGSTDGSPELVEKLADPRIHLIRQPNTGVSAARNTGIREARGKYIALLDADDFWKPELLETFRDMSERYPDCQVFAGRYVHQMGEQKDIPIILNKIPFEGKDGRLENYFEVAATSNPPVWSSCVATTREVFDSVGGFPVGVKSGEDLLTWARIAARYNIAYCLIPLAVYYTESDYVFSNSTHRKQDEKDPVGAELLKLYCENKSVRGLKEYVGLWHKMRASTAIRYGDRRETLRESFTALRYNPKNYKVIPFIVLALLPGFMRRAAINRYAKSQM